MKHWHIDKLAEWQPAGWDECFYGLMDVHKYLMKEQMWRSYTIIKQNHLNELEDGE